MAGTFPNLSSGNVCAYPTTRVVSATTRVLRTLDDSEQRWRCAAFISSWELQYSRLKWADVETLRAFFETQKGSFDTTWTFPFEGTSYQHLSFDQDEFTFTESQRTQFDVSLRIRQVKQSGTYETGEAATYPTINNAVVTQLPFSTTLRYSTVRNAMPSGLIFTRSELDNPRRSWSCSYPMITGTEADTLLDFYTSMGGRHLAFSFTDPNTSTVYTARFAQDEFRRQYVNFNQNSVTLLLEQVTA